MLYEVITILDNGQFGIITKNSEEAFRITSYNVCYTKLLRFCLVASGKAHVYPRLAPTMEWDTAAGQAICNAVGVKVVNQETGGELQYNKENLLNPSFVVEYD